MSFLQTENPYSTRQRQNQYHLPEVPHRIYQEELITMFGYITVHKDELKIKDYNTYRGYYCGLCRELGAQHGQVSRLSLTYDMTFLIILLTGLYEAETTETRQRCPLHPGHRHLSLRNEFTQYAADMNVLLTFYNLRDDWSDDKKLSSLAMSKALEKSTKEIMQRYPAQAKAVVQYMKKLSDCEKSGERNLDTAAGYTGEMLGEIFACREDVWAPTLRRMGFYLGKFIYLCDAWEDLEKDKKSGSYNPLLFYENDDNFDEKIHTILTMMAAGCAKEFEKLPILQHADILRNVLYSGIWARYELTNAKRREQSKKP